jgi:hypothetical protein
MTGTTAGDLRPVAADTARMTSVGTLSCVADKSRDASAVPLVAVDRVGKAGGRLSAVSGTSASREDPVPGGTSATSGGTSPTGVWATGIWALGARVAGVGTPVVGTSTTGVGASCLGTSTTEAGTSPTGVWATGVWALGD